MWGVHPRHASFCCVAQEKHAVFSAPVVKRAFCIASAIFTNSAQLEANAGTAAILADLRLDADTVAAALLQGALDASPLTGEQLSKLMPPGVAAMVAATSRINSTCVALQADHNAKVGPNGGGYSCLLIISRKSSFITNFYPSFCIVTSVITSHIYELISAQRSTINSALSDQRGEFADLNYVTLNRAHIAMSERFCILNGVLDTKVGCF